MNVVRDLRNEITHLKAELLKQEERFIEKQQQYEEIINSLQSENQRLKSLLESQSFGERQVSSRFDSQGLNEHHSPKNVNDKQKKNDNIIYIDSDEYSSLINENIFLKNEITEISSTYQKQIEQIIYYFQKIKQENNRLLPSKAHYSGQLNYIQKVYSAFVKDTEVEKSKYITKLLEYAKILQEYQNIIKQRDNTIQQLLNNAREQEEQIKILRRLSI